MTAGNLSKLEKRIDNATSELLNALELFGDMNFKDDNSLTGINAEMERVGIYFENLVGVRNQIEEIREQLEGNKNK